MNQRLRCVIYTCPGLAKPGYDYCPRHTVTDRIGKYLVTFGAIMALAIAAMTLMSGCVSVKRYNRERELLHQARVHYRSCMRIVHDYGMAGISRHPEQEFDGVDFGTAGH